MSPVKRLAYATAAALIAGVGFANCGDLGPDEGELGHLAIQPVFAEGAAAVDVTAIRARLSRPGETGFVADTTIPLETDSGTVEIPLTVRLATSPENFLLEILIIGTQGDTVFRGGPTPITVRAGTDEPTVTEVEIEYVGLGSDAAFILIEPPTRTVPVGTDLEFEAIVFDSSETPIEGVPVLWSSTDTTRARVPDRDVGNATTHAEGVVWIVAQTLSGQIDSALANIVPPRPPQTIRWINPEGGDWEIDANWEGGVAPLHFDTALIDLDANYTITVNSVVDVTALTVGSGSRQNVQELRLLDLLSVSGDATLNSSGKLTLATGGRFTTGEQLLLGGQIVSSGTNANINAFGGIQGAGGVLDVASGTLSISGDLILTSTDILRGSGSLDLNNASTVQLGGTIAPGTSPGILGIVGDLSFAPETRLAIELDGTGVTQIDRLDVNGNLVFDGMLDVLFPGTFVPTPGDTFTIATYQGASGQFSSVSGTDLGNGVQLIPEYDQNELRLITVGPQPVFTVQPSDVLPGQYINPVIEIDFQDPITGNPIDFPNEVTLTLENNPTGANLIGETQTFSDGPTAFFGSTGVDRAGTGYTIRVSAPGAFSEESAPFNVIEGIVFAGTDGNLQAVSSLHPNGTNLTTISLLQGSSTISSYPRWSPNRLRVVHTFTDPSLGVREIRVASSARDTLATLVTDTSGFRPQWNRTGQHIAFHCGDGFSNQQDVCTIQNIGTVPITALTGIGNGAGKTYVTDASVMTGLDGPGAFAWDPGIPDRLAVARTIQGPSRPVTQLFTVNADGSNAAPLGSPLTTPAGDTLNIEELTWAPDGSFLVFSAENELTGRARIYRVNRDGSGLQLLTGNPTDFYDENHPVVSPDGSSIIFIQNDFDFEGSDWNYFIVPATGGTPQQMSNETSFFIASDELGVDFSPDGSQIVFVGVDTSQPSPQPAIFVAPVTMRQATYFTDRVMISPPARMDVQPNWRP